MTRQRQAAQHERAAQPKQTLDTSHLQDQLFGLRRKAAARKSKLQSNKTADEGLHQDLAQEGAAQSSTGKLSVGITSSTYGQNLE